MMNGGVNSMQQLILEPQALFLNLWFVFTLFFIYYHFIEKSKENSLNKITLLSISVLSIILCMTFSIGTVDGFIFDLRPLPLIIGTLYGGRRVGLSLVLVIIIYRSYLGIDTGLIASLIIFPIVYAFLCKITPIFTHSFTVKRKIITAGIACLFGNIITAMTVYFLHIQLDFLGSLILFILFFLQLTCIIIFIVLIERAKHQRLIFDELSKLEKLKTVSDIAASISHEVRNPLTVTKGFLQLLREPDINETKKFQYINYSLNELVRAEEIITDYLTFAKPSLENIKVLELNREIEYVVKVILPYGALHNVHIDFEKTNEIYIIGERQKFHQALINLSKNGIEAIKDGGTLILRLNESDKNAIVRIMDNGIGMDAEQVKKLGSPYYSTKDKGTGLGTMVVYSIIKVMSGKIKVESSIGKGTCFTILIPKVIKNT